MNWEIGRIVNWHPGSKVRMVCCPDALMNPEQIYITQSVPCFLDGEQVVRLEGKINAVPTELLELVEEDK